MLLRYKMSYYRLVGIKTFFFYWLSLFFKDFVNTKKKIGNFLSLQIFQFVTCEAENQPNSEVLGYDISS